MVLEQQPRARSHPSFAGRIGIARIEITPPVGIPSQNWGAAEHDLAESIHRPLFLTALSFAPREGGKPMVLVEADLGFWRDNRIIQTLREQILDELGLDSARLIFGLSHTHAGVTLTTPDPAEPGAGLLQSYLQTLPRRTIDTIRRALDGATDALLEWNTGRCSLAAARDLPDPDPAADRVICGYDPDGPTDDTLLVGRITDSDGATLATLVNYACHPTTLAWDNRAISPDFVGATRETIERAVGGTAVFIQGASGELAPRYQYVGDPGVADRHGRQLGYAALATLEDMEPPGTQLVFDRVVESAAPLAVWRHKPRRASTDISASELTVELPLKDWPSADELEEQRLACEVSWARERLRRKRDTRIATGDQDSLPLSLWVWKLGEVIFAGVSGEAYMKLQQEIRSRFPQLTVVCMTLVNESVCGYLPPAELYGRDIYQVWRTPFDQGCLETTIDALCQAIEEIVTQDREVVLSDSAASHNASHNS